MEKLDFAKIHTVDQILRHLSKAANDRRPRERKRVQVALKKINSWIREGVDIYEKEQRKRPKVEIKG